MSDQSTQLATIANDVNNLISSGASLPEIQQHLETLWNAGGDETAITTVWNQVQHLATVAQDAAELARSAVDVANEMLDQRNLIADQLSEVVKEHEDLKDALESFDYNHPLLEDFVQGIEENAYDTIYNSGYDEPGIHDNDPAETISQNGHFGDDCAPDEAVELIEIIMGYNDPLTEEMYAELATFITDFTARARAYINDVHEKRMAEVERRRAEWLAAQQQKAQAAS